MKLLNKTEIKTESRSVNESYARICVSAFIAQLDPDIEELSDIKTAVSEAVTNCIVHAYKDIIGTITITVYLYENRLVKIKIKDKGCGIEDIKQAMEPLFTTSEGERAGLGFAVMESFCDRLGVRSVPGKGTTVTLIKRLKERQ